MQNYILLDDKGNAGKTLPVNQGETKVVTLLALLPNGAPQVIPDPQATIVVKIFSQINQSPIQKTLAGSTVTPVVCAVLGGQIGYQFTLTAADTAGMAGNNSGLPLSVTATDSGSKVTLIEVPAAFSVSVPVV